MAEDSKTPQYSLSVESSLTKLVDVLSWFESCYAEGIPMASWLSVKIALAEAFTNAVRHAHRKLPKETPVEISVTFSPTKLRFEIFDRGAPFDLSGHLADRSQSKNNLYATHGRGLQLLTSIADRVEYRRLPDGRNCLEFVTTFTPE